MGLQELFQQMYAENQEGAIPQILAQLQRSQSRGELLDSTYTQGLGKTGLFDKSQGRSQEPLPFDQQIRRSVIDDEHYEQMDVGGMPTWNEFWAQTTQGFPFK